MARTGSGAGDASHAFKVWLTEASLGELLSRGWGHEINWDDERMAIGRLEDGAIGIIVPCAHGCGVIIFERIGGKNPGRKLSYSEADHYLITEDDGFWISTEERQIIKAEAVARIRRGERLPYLNPDAVLGWRTLFR